MARPVPDSPVRGCMVWAGEAAPRCGLVLAGSSSDFTSEPLRVSPREGVLAVEGASTRLPSAFLVVAVSNLSANVPALPVDEGAPLRRVELPTP